jgi:hypothetical protein
MAEYFTREGAEALLPQLEPVLLELRALRGDLRRIEERVDALQRPVRGNGHSHQGELVRLRREAAGIIEAVDERVRRINAWGVLVKDLETGLVDFPSLRAGREVYLCWRLGEPRVAWWHTVEGGFAARQPLEE